MTVEPWSAVDAPAGEAAARQRVRLVSYLALAAVVVGAVLGISGRVAVRDGLAWAGSGVLAAGVLAGLGCVRHNIRNAHERGVVVASVAILVGLGALAVIGADVIVEIRFYSREPG